eukprot:scaffold120133_cov47-Phaeocystis_antarctica.AAC.2
MIIRVAAGTLHTLVHDPAAPNSPHPVPYSVHLYGSSALLHASPPSPSSPSSTRARVHKRRYRGLL